jgi:hypothetical protein
MALNTVVAGRAWLYSHNIGRNAQAGMGFSNPVGVAATAPASKTPACGSARLP